MSFKIYTKTGDQGKTALIGGTKVPKSDLRIDAYGTVDELNSYIGLVSDHLSAYGDTVTLLREIQDRGGTMLARRLRKAVAGGSGNSMILRILSSCRTG